MAQKQENYRKRQFGRLRYQPRGKGVSIAVNLAPMIDVTFLLLIFFLVTMTFERAEGLFTTPMPNQGSGVTVSLPLEPIVIRLSASTSDPSGVSITMDHVADQPESIDAIVGIIQAMHAQPAFDEDTPVAIVADDEVIWDNVVAVWNAALRAGCRKVAFAEP